MATGVHSRAKSFKNITYSVDRPHDAAASMIYFSRCEQTTYESCYIHREISRHQKNCLATCNAGFPKCQNQQSQQMLREETCFGHSEIMYVNKSHRMTNSTTCTPSPFPQSFRLRKKNTEMSISEYADSWVRLYMWVEGRNANPPTCGHTFVKGKAPSAEVKITRKRGLLDFSLYKAEVRNFCSSKCC